VGLFAVAALDKALNKAVNDKALDQSQRIESRE